MKSRVVFLVIWLASSAAMAQEANSPAAASPPLCGRSGNRIAMAGVDMDVQRCKEAVARQARIRTEDLLIEAQSELLLTKADLDIAAHHQADVERRRADVEKLCAGIPDCAKQLKPDASNDEQK